jgi:gluconate 2-dehydrogenase gamma chain
MDNGRRSFLKIAGATAATTTLSPVEAATTTKDATTPASAARARTPYTFFNASEAAFVEAAVARLIPADDLGPGALEAGVPSYIDRQLSGAWGAGERLYRQGPWHQGAPTQGYQLPFTPAELFRTAMRGVLADVERKHKIAFARLAPNDQDAYLKALETGKDDLNGVPASVFFATLLEMTVEGFFSDPVYGGNRDMIGWKLIGFPGAYASYYPYVGDANLAFVKPPVSLAEDAAGHVHVDPQRPAYGALPRRDVSNAKAK